MNIVINSETAGRRIINMEAAGSGFTPDGRLILKGLCKTSPVVSIQAGYSDIILTTESGSQYVVTPTDEELKSYLIQNMMLLTLHLPTFEGLIGSAFSTRFSEAHTDKHF